MKKLLVILPRVPYPLEKGDKLRAFHQIKCLSKEFSICLVALNDQPLHPKAEEILKPYCSSIYIINMPHWLRAINICKALINGKPLQVGYYFQNRAKKKINEIFSNENPDYLYCQLLRVAEYAKDFALPKTIDYQDVFSVGMERRSQKSFFPASLIFKIEANRLQKYEAIVFDLFDNKTIISEPDRELLPHPGKNNIMVIPNGVDFVFFNALKSEKKFDLAFTGNMNYPPNVDAAVFLVKKVMPLVWKTNQSVNVLISGATPHKKVQKLRSEKVHVSGWVEDIRQSYAQSRIFIAPMFIGTGLQNKLLEAMAMKMPCITTSLANDALCAKPKSEILIGDSAEALADAIITLINDPILSDQIAENGNSFVLKNFDWNKNTKELIKLIKNE